MRQNVEVLFAKLEPDAAAPTQGSKSAAGWDLRALEDTVVMKGSIYQNQNRFGCCNPRGLGRTDSFKIIPRSKRHDYPKMDLGTRFCLKRELMVLKRDRWAILHLSKGRKNRPDVDCPCT
ncbi:MAG: hypothetical protein CM15mP71_1930 [Candidatus Poseidoniales archaeon]|nr:MAG: hypothetical protein CM15mP71_1930 [Candidatus Poseidoniales archaeon]